jgi:hypothetical protein
MIALAQFLSSSRDIAALWTKVACMYDVHIGIDVGLTQGAGVRNIYEPQSRSLEFPRYASQLTS